jgi:hypothetical protein
MPSPTHHDPLEFLMSLVSSIEQSPNNASVIAGLFTRLNNALGNNIITNLINLTNINNILTLSNAGQYAQFIWPVYCVVDGAINPPSFVCRDSVSLNTATLQCAASYSRVVLKDNEAPNKRTFNIEVGTNNLLGQGFISIKDATDGNDLIAADHTAADTETCLLIRRNVAGVFSTQRVSMGAADSGGAGFKLLRVPN